MPVWLRRFYLKQIEAYIKKENEAAKGAQQNTGGVTRFGGAK